MSRYIDITGNTFGNIKIIKLSHIDNGGNSVWDCECICGNKYKINRSNIIRSSGVGCKMCRNKKMRNDKHIHGMTDTRIHTIWMHLISRCNKPQNIDYKNYGGRGISVCSEWEQDFMSFYVWAKDNGYSDNLSIDRIDVNGNYEPNNCRWVNSKIQNNNRRNNVHFTINDISHTLSEWCEIYKANYELVKGRLKRGIDIETALTTEKKKPFGFQKIQIKPIR